MTVGEISDEILSFLQTNSSSLITAASADIRLRALNRARLHLERRRDWTASYVYCQLMANPTANITDAKLASDGTTAVTVKALRKAYARMGGKDIPVRFVSRGVEHAEQKGYQDARPAIDSWMNDYNNLDAEIETNEPRVIWNGTTVEYRPTVSEAITLRFDAYKWLSEYTTSSNTDFFTVRGHDALFWSALVELNYITTTWSEFEREGDMRPPIQMRDIAIESLILDDESSEPSLV